MFGIKSGIVLDRKLGFVKTEVFGFLILIVWGFHGNCYGPIRGMLRIELGRTGVWDCIVTVRGRRMLETMFYLSHKMLPHWNSEHIALWYGTQHGDDPACPAIPSHNVYRGILGYHIYL